MLLGWSFPQFLQVGLRAVQLLGRISVAGYCLCTSYLAPDSAARTPDPLYREGWVT